MLSRLKNIPFFIGEKDVLKSIQFLPGIKSAGDGNSGFYVRGGSADQNLVLLDGAPVYNASHLMGFFSVFNSDVIHNFSLYKGVCPHNMGRLSSVLDVTMNEGANQEYHMSGGIGVIAARLNAEGPILKNNSSFAIAGRRTYADLFLKLSHDSAIRNNDLNFYDLNLKLSFAAGAQDQVSVSTYTGHDRMRIGQSLSVDWGNNIVSLQWKHLFKTTAVANTSLYYSHYNYKATIPAGKEIFSTFSKINDLGAKTEILWMPDANHEFRIGLQSALHTMHPGQITVLTGKTGINSRQEPRRHSLDNALYINNTWRLSGKAKISYGMRLTTFSMLGGSVFYQVNNAGAITDTLHYGTGQIVKTYMNLEPRIAISYSLHRAASFTCAYVRNVQPLHLLASARPATPADKWIASNNMIQPEIADQFSAGVTQKTKNSSYTLTIEAYYKLLQHQLYYRNGTEIFNNDPVETKLLSGKGRAYGVEWLLKKKSEKLTGWIEYTLSKTERKINGISNNEWYAFRQDRTHEIAIISSLQLSSRWLLSANWVFNTGNAVTLPAGKYIINNKVVYYYTKRKGSRMPAYHRLDLSATVQLHRKTVFLQN